MIKYDDVLMHRVFARANAETFKIKPIMELIRRYAGDGKGWADPFAGWSTFAEYRNDMNPARGQPYQMEANRFARHLFDCGVKLKGGLLDPPYSHRQTSEHYSGIGMKATALDTSANFTIRVKRELAASIVPGGYAISFGWNTSGFGKCLGFKKVEILDVAHGLTHNDTLVTVEVKL